LYRNIRQKRLLCRWLSHYVAAQLFVKIPVQVQLLFSMATECNITLYICQKTSNISKFQQFMTQWTIWMINGPTVSEATAITHYVMC